jgi:hypothetical protein
METQRVPASAEFGDSFSRWPESKKVSFRRTIRYRIDQPLVINTPIKTTDQERYRCVPADVKRRYYR